MIIQYSNQSDASESQKDERSASIEALFKEIGTMNQYPVIQVYFNVYHILLFYIMFLI